jgi:hypothetical protein
MREQCHLLVLGGTLVMVALVLLLTLVQPMGVLAGGIEPASCPVPATNDYHSPQCCSQCHPDKYHAWSQTSHAVARIDPVFVVDLEKELVPGDCYACHSTGYDAGSGEYALPGVTCEACHQPYQAGHSADSMDLPQHPPLCGTCHTKTLEDWQAGAHGESDKTCCSCHPPH